MNYSTVYFPVNQILKYKTEIVYHVVLVMSTVPY